MIRRRPSARHAVAQSSIAGPRFRSMLSEHIVWRPCENLRKLG